VWTLKARMIAIKSQFGSRWNLS